MNMRPQEHEYAPFYSGYIQLASEGEPLVALEKATEEISHLLPLLPEGKSDHRYAPDKWSVKQLLQHAIDTERIMAYRALAIARGESVSLPGFDENAYAEEANVSYRSLEDLRAEFLCVRKATLCLFQSFDTAALRKTGTANNSPISVLALAYIIAGHQRHHMNILKDRYFPEQQLVKV